MKVYTTDTPKSKLANIPDRERILLIGVGHIANEISVLQKLFYWASCSVDEHELIKKAHTTQAITLAKILAGKLFEGWIFVEKAFFSSSLSKDWESKLPPETTDALNELKKYFGRKNLINNIRNNFAFHYSAADMDSGFSLPPDEDGWKIFLSESNANSLYYVADLVANYAMLESIRPGQHKVAIEKLIDEIIRVARLFIEFSGGCWIVGINKYLLSDEGKIPMKEYNIDFAPLFDGVELPFFVEMPSNAPKSNSE